MLNSRTSFVAILRLLPLILPLASLSCNGSDDSPPEGMNGTAGRPGFIMGCNVTAPTACPDPAPRYADVEPIFMTRCVVCHGGMEDVWPLNNYEDISHWSAEIQAHMLACTMPPIESGMTMPVSERELLLQWIRCKRPR